MAGKPEKVDQVVRSRAALAPEIQAAFRDEAKRRGCWLKTVQREAVVSFLGKRQDLLKTGKQPTYFATPRSEQGLQVILPAELTQEASAAAELDRVSLSQLLHTALKMHHDAGLPNVS